MSQIRHFKLWGGICPGGIFLGGLFPGMCMSRGGGVVLSPGRLRVVTHSTNFDKVPSLRFM